MNKTLSYTLGGALAATCMLSACGGGSGSDDSDRQEGDKLYVGYYLEDPVNNPEDPTPGTMILRLPPDTGAFEGQMPFSYVGCMGGADVGTVKGTRSAAGLEGNWTGTVDNVAVGGNYTGTYDAAHDEFRGTYQNSGGKVHVQAGDCHHDIAALGTWKLFGSGTTNTPSDFVVNSTGGVKPTWSWRSLGSTVFYLVRVFDQDCLNESVTSVECMMGEAETAGTQVAYPSAFPDAKPLVAGTSYLIAVHAVNVVDRQQVGFSTRVDKP
ncbi:hypothetical protein AACH06_09645 [Ideonella sp. DXS29W]|uniref:Lipoprotein n=1 Tax=Ideonella lacteola TaxID=2984193 RepID=A0ABU9BM97_9BURK